MANRCGGAAGGHAGGRWAAGQYDRLPALAADLISRQVTVMVASGGQTAVRAVKSATETIPIVFTAGSDPVQSGIVASLSRPEGNATGVSFASRPLAAKRLELIRELLPKATTMAVLQNSENPIRPAEMAELNAGAAALGQQLRLLSASTVAEIDQAFVQLGQQRPDALQLYGDLFFTGQRDLIVALAARHRIPTIYHAAEYVRSGGLMSYGASSVRPIAKPETTPVESSRVPSRPSCRSCCRPSSTW